MDYLPFPTYTVPIMNAAGTLGFAPNPRGPFPLAQLGAFMTNPISLAPRRPAENRAMLPFAGGFLLHTGLPNPGLSGVLRQYAPRWADSSLPVIVHLLAGDPAEVARMVQRLEGIDGVSAVEIGLPPLATAALAVEMAQAAFGELPFSLSLPPERLLDLLPALHKAGVRTVSLAPARGTLPAADGQFVTGRLYGPALLPLALAAVRLAVQQGMQVIAAGGVYRHADLVALRTAGADAVQVDAALWRGGNF